MLGELAVSFCERKSGKESLCIDLWAYPDGTCNMVVAAFTGAASHELVFPCAPEQLHSVIGGRNLRLKNDAGAVEVEQCDDMVCASFESRASRSHFKQCIPIEEYRLAIERVIAASAGYLS